MLVLLWKSTGEVNIGSPSLALPPPHLSMDLRVRSGEQGTEIWVEYEFCFIPG